MVILKSSYEVLKESIDILKQGTPVYINIDENNMTRKLDAESIPNSGGTLILIL